VSDAVDPLPGQLPLPGMAVRLCEPFTPLPSGAYSCPDSCRVEQCALCLGDVHYPPAAVAPGPGEEIIICLTCMRQPAGVQD
jgi:hypothetical protein